MTRFLNLLASLRRKNGVIPSPSRGGLGRGEFSKKPHLKIMRDLAVRLTAKRFTVFIWDTGRRAPLPDPPREGEGITPLLRQCMSLNLRIAYSKKPNSLSPGWLLFCFAQICLICFLFAAFPALAASQGEPLADPAAEARAVAIGNRLRCVVCQSESINDSQADMARDLRHLVRDKIQAGWSDRQIFDYARARYGDFILLSPPLQANTSLLWLSPLLFAVLAALAGFAFFRRRSQGESQ
jgi:cytochrome c-type biogenesis protein CcmH